MVLKQKDVKAVVILNLVLRVSELRMTAVTALCGYPNVKVSIRDLSQISTAALIFQLYIYFRQNLEENVTFTFFFLVLPQISLVKYYETIKILMQIFVYFKFHFDNDECPG